MTSYFPISNPAGKVIGILYVESDRRNLTPCLAEVMRTMMIVAAFAALSFWAITNAGGTPGHQAGWHRLRQMLTAIADGRNDVETACDDRATEVGDIARTVAVCKSNALERQRSSR